jgi:hypothetical protein
MVRDFVDFLECKRAPESYLDWWTANADQVKLFVNFRQFGRLRPSGVEQHGALAAVSNCFREVEAILKK